MVLKNIRGRDPGQRHLRETNLSLLLLVSIDLHRASPTTVPILTRVLIGDAQPKIRLVGPHRVAL